MTIRIAAVLAATILLGAQTAPDHNFQECPECPQMVGLPAGKFLMGSPDSEAERGEDESPLHKMKIAPFWMGKCEVTWDEYDIFSYSLDAKRRAISKTAASDRDKLADAVTKPTTSSVL